MKRAVGRAVVACLAVLSLLGMAPTPASAQTVTLQFEEGNQNTSYWGAIVRDGIYIGNPSGQTQHFHITTGALEGYTNNSTGILLNDLNTQIEMRYWYWNPFHLTSVDVAGYGTATAIRITGYLNDKKIASYEFALNGKTFTRITGLAFGRIDRVVFDGLGGDGTFALDNVTFNPGPEPPSLALLLPALGALGIVHRRRRGRET